MTDNPLRGGLFLAGVLAALAAISLPGVAAREPDGEPAAEKIPKLVRVVCTDHICANCDGRCHRNSGHVAVDKRGHCACTPTAGSALDQATRDAYEKHPPD